MDKSDIERRIKILTIYALLSPIILLLLIFVTLSYYGETILTEKNRQFSSSDSLHVSYLSVERLDVVEPEGQLAIALSNSKRSAKLRFDGQLLHGASNRDIPNIIFFDGKGDEVGGLAFANFRDEDSPFRAIRHLAFDGYRQDEVLTLSHFVQSGKSRKGLYIYDRPDIPILDALEESGVKPEDTPEILGQKLNRFKEVNPDRHKQLWGNPRRVAVQTNETDEAELLLGDANGNIRIRLVVKPEGRSFIEFLDDAGNSLRRIEP